jgi:hypothetical protein
MQQLRSVFSGAAVASGLLGALLVDAPANAAVYDFSFGAGVYGTITTGAAAADPGYQLVTGLTFDLLSGETSQGSDFSFMNQVASELETTAAYNPTTQAFINHYEGGDFDDLGNFSLPAPVEITPGAFSLGSSGLSGSVFLGSGLEYFDIQASLVILEPLPLPVPEPATWAMVTMGFLALGLAGYRAKTSQVVS